MTHRISCEYLEFLVSFGESLESKSFLQKLLSDKISSERFCNRAREKFQLFFMMEFYLFSPPFRHRKISSSVFCSTDTCWFFSYQFELSYRVAHISYKCNTFAFKSKNVKLLRKCMCVLSLSLYDAFTDIKCYGAIFKVLIIYLTVCSIFCVNMVTNRKNLAILVGG